ncbi:MAG: hypothetical protein GY898_33020 [Proteobacteria bacterium]|nr:hypothetical protein [Pseudomonadota bacterium]
MTKHLLWGLVLLVVVMTAGAVQKGTARGFDPALHDSEERYNAAHAIAVRDGGTELAAPLKYHSSCGGCAVVARIGARVFADRPASISNWRTIGWLFFLLALVSGVAVATRAAGPAGGVACAVLFLGAPPTYQALAAISNGNHPEGGAILMLELALAVAACTAAHVVVRSAGFVLLMLLVPWGMQFVESLQLGVVLLALSVVLVRGPIPEALARAATLVVVELATGWFGVRSALGDLGAEPGDGHEEGRFTLSTEYVGRNLETLLEPSQIEGIWGFTETGLGFAAALPAMLAAGALLLIGPILAFRKRPVAEEDEHEIAPRAVLLAAILPIAFFGLYLLFDRRIGGGGGGVPAPNQLRYLGLIYPAILVAAGCGAGRLWLDGRRGTRVIGVVLVALLAFPGALARISLAGPEAQEAGALADLRLAPSWCYAMHAFDKGEHRAALTEATPFDFASMAEGAAAMKQGVTIPPVEVPTEPSALRGWRMGAMRQAWGGSWGTGRPVTELVPAITRAWPILTSSSAADWLDSTLGGASDIDRIALETLWCVERESLRNSAFSGDVPTGVARLKQVPDLTGLATRIYGAGFASQYGPHGRLSGRSLVLEDFALVPEDGGPPRDKAWAWGFGWGLGAELASNHGPRVEYVRLKLDVDHAAALVNGFDAGYGYALRMEWVLATGPTVEVVAP